MSGKSPGNIVVLTQRGCFPSAADFEADPEGATDRLLTEALRIHAEAMTCLSHMLGRIVGDCKFDLARLTALSARAAQLRGVITLANAAAETAALRSTSST